MKSTASCVVGIAALLALSATNAANYTSSDIDNISSLPEAQTFATACSPSKTAGSASGEHSLIPCDDSSCRRALESFSAALPACEIDGTKLSKYYFTQLRICETEAVEISVGRTLWPLRSSSAANIYLSTATIFGGFAVAATLV